jgi:hypothetical protein
VRRAFTEAVLGYAEWCAPSADEGKSSSLGVDDSAFANVTFIVFQ